MAAQFLPVADTQFRLRGTDAPSKWFRRVEAQGHYAGQPFSTRQGIYVCTAGGELLASTTPAEADSVLVVLRRGIQAWKDHPEWRGSAPRRIESAAIGEDRFPRDGLVLALTIRDLGDDVGEPADEPALPSPFPSRFREIERATNFDHVWFTRTEKLEWIPERLAVGESRRIANAIVARLAALHLLHSAKFSIPPPFRPEDVGASWIESRIVAIEGTRVRLRIRGATSAERPRRLGRGAPCRMDTHLLGDATFDTARQSFERFEVVALGRWAERGEPADGDAGRREGTASPAGRPVGFAFTLAGEDASSGVPPHYLRRYEGEWAAPEGNTRPPARPVSAATPAKPR